MYECQSKPKIRINLESPDGNNFCCVGKRRKRHKAVQYS